MWPNSLKKNKEIYSKATALLGLARQRAGTTLDSLLPPFLPSLSLLSPYYLSLISLFSIVLILYILYSINLAIKLESLELSSN